MDEKGPASDNNRIEEVWRLKLFSDGSLAMEIVMKIQPETEIETWLAILVATEVH